MVPNFVPGTSTLSPPRANSSSHSSRISESMCFVHLRIIAKPIFDRTWMVKGRIRACAATCATVHSFQPSGSQLRFPLPISLRKARRAAGCLSYHCRNAASSPPDMDRALNEQNRFEASSSIDCVFVCKASASPLIQAHCVKVNWEKSKVFFGLGVRWPWGVWMLEGRIVYAPRTQAPLHDGCMTVPSRKRPKGATHMLVRGHARTKIGWGIRGCRSLYDVVGDGYLCNRSCPRLCRICSLDLLCSSRRISPRQRLQHPSQIASSTRKS